MKNILSCCCFSSSVFKNVVIYAILHQPAILRTIGLEWIGQSAFVKCDNLCVKQHSTD